MAFKEAAQHIRALEPCRRFHVALLSKQEDRLANNTDSLDALCNNISSCFHPRCCHRSDGGITLSFPVSLSLSATASGAPDLHIQLFHLQWGCLETDTPRCQSNDSNHCSALCRQDGHPSTHAPSPADSFFPVRSPGAGPYLPKRSARPGLPSPLSPHSPTAAQYLSSAGAMLLFAVLHSDVAAAWGPRLVLPGLAMAAAEAAVAVSEFRKRRRLKGGCTLIALAPSVASKQQQQEHRQRPLRQLASGADCIGRPLAQALQRIMVPTALLSLAGRAWRVAHASSAALAEAVVDLLAVGLSYSCLTRQAQLGRLPPGPVREAAWRRCHKAAAQRLARHLTDLPPTPPLGPSLAALQRCSIAAGLAVQGRPLCGVADALAPYRAVGGGDDVRLVAARVDVPQGSRCPGAGGGTGSSGRQLMLSMSYCHSKCRRQAATATSGVGNAARAPGSTAAGAITALPCSDAAAGGEGALVRPSVSAVPADANAGAPSGAATATSSTAAADPTAIPMRINHNRPQAGFPDPTPLGTPAAVQTLSVCNTPEPKSPPPRCPPPPTDGTELPWARTDPDLDPDSGTMIPHSHRYRSHLEGQSPPRSQAARDTELAVSISPSTTPSTTSAPNSPSAAVRRGLPRAASASSLRALAPASQVPAAELLASAVAAAVLAPSRTKHSVSDVSASEEPAAAPTTTTSNGPFQSLPDVANVVVDAKSGEEVPSPSLRDRTVPSSHSHASQGCSSCGATASPRPAGRPVVRRIHGVALLAANWIRNLYLSGAAVKPPQSEPVSVHAAAADAFPLDHGPVGASWEATLRGPLTRSQALELMQREQEEVEALGLPLYGRADHVNPSAHSGPMRLRERLDLTCRAAYLAAAFLPFLTLGVALLLMAALLGRSQPAAAGSDREHVVHLSTHGDGGHGGNSEYGSQSAVILAGRDADGGGEWRCRTATACRRRAWRLLLGGVRRSGAALIKWGQWAATRVDIFPDDFCEVLSELHDRAPTHSFAYTRQQVESSFGVPLGALFETFDPLPVASGSIAQVHRATLRCGDGSCLAVAVKVVHPGVERRIRQDFALLHSAASVLGRLPSLRGLSLSDTVSQFSASMTAQADLRVEAAHLRRFYANFARVVSQVTTPRPLPGLVRREVLVESWEPGVGVASFIRQPGPLNTGIVCLGVDTYLKMLLQDNFVHTDLHPGNIMVRLVGPDGSAMPLSATNTTTSSSSPSSGVPPAACPASASHGAFPLGGCGDLQLVLLDFGLAEELSPAVRHHFISLLHHLMRGDGAAAASHLLRWTSRPQACPDPAALTADLTALAATACNVHSAAGMDLDAVMKAVLRLARRHRVTIDSAYASLVVAVCVIVGFATSLDPGVNLVDAAVPALLAHALTGRVVGRLYS